MKLYLVRHGESLNKGVAPEQPLSEKGKADVFKIANFLKGKIKVDRLWHSKKLRAIQTAEIFKERGLIENLFAREDMNPLDEVKKFSQEIMNSNLDLMLVGHLPFLVHLACLLLLKNKDLGLIKFCSGGVLCLEKEEDWRLLWMVIPPLLPFPL